MRVLFVLLFIVGSSSLVVAQINIWDQLKASFSSGVNLIEDEQSLTVIPGDNQLRPSFGLSVTRSQVFSEKAFWRTGLGIRYNAIAINDEAYNGTTVGPVTSGSNPNSWRRDSRIRYLTLELPLSIGINFGKKQQWQSAVGVFGSYRFANFTHVSQETVERYGWVNVINADGSITQRFLPLAFPYVSNTKERKADIPTDKFQYGIRTNVDYFIGNKFQKEWNVGFLFDYFLSENNVTFSSNLRYHFALTLSTTL